MIWICREKCFWRDVTWEPGKEYGIDSIDPGTRFELGRGWWVPEGTEIIGVQSPLCIPWYFEPKDMSVLVDPKQVYLARDHKMNARKWKFDFEMTDDEEVDYRTLPNPKPLDEKDFEALQADPDAVKVNKPKRRRRGPNRPKKAA